MDLTARPPASTDRECGRTARPGLCRNLSGSSATGRYAHGNVVFALGRQMHCVVFVGDKAHLFGMFTQLWRVIENRTLIVVETDR